MGRREFLKKVINTGIVVIFGVGLASCTKISGTQEVPVVDNKTPLTATLPDNAKATEELPTTIPTEVPPIATPSEIPPTPTATEIPVTVSPEVIATPNYYNFAEFSPGEATVNEATFKDVKIKYAYSEVSSVMKGIDPNIAWATYPDIVKKTFFYFMTDRKDIAKNIVDKNTYLKVTYSKPDGSGKFIEQGCYKDSKTDRFSGYGSSEESDPVGGFVLMFNTDGKVIVQSIEMARTRDEKQNAVMIYQR